MKKQEVVQELKSQGMHVGKSKNVDELKKDLHEVLHGQVRLPDIFLGNLNADICEMCSSKLEITEGEFMHDFVGVFQNVNDELPFHVGKDAADEIRKFYQKCKGYAVQFVEFCDMLRGKRKIDAEVLLLSKVLMEISEKGYAAAENIVQRVSYDFTT